MGLFRKVTSLSTLGLVDFRSDKERTARNTARAGRAIRSQNRLIREQMKQSAGQWPAGWYPDPSNPSLVRWYDGKKWTENVQPRRF